MASFNRIILVGNLTRDPDYKLIASGQAVCRLGIATNRQFKNKQNGSMVQEVCYVDVDVWGPQAESCRQYLQKGRPVLIEGRLKYDSWDDQNGQKRSRHTIVADSVTFLGSNNTTTTPDIDDASRFAMSDSTNEESVMQLNPNNPVERDLLQQLELAKEKKQSKAKDQLAPKQPVQVQDKGQVMGEIDFQDEPPFEDQLPF